VAATVDWVRAELLYRQGEISIREIARREGVGDGAVRKRAKAQGWERDSASSVRSLVRTQPGGSSVSSVSIVAQVSSTRLSAEEGCFFNGEEDEAPEWYRSLMLANASSEAERAQTDACVDAEASIRLVAHVDPAFRDAFRIFTDQEGWLLAIGREPKLAATQRLLEEGLATARSKVELVFVDGYPTEFFTVGDVVG